MPIISLDKAIADVESFGRMEDYTPPKEDLPETTAGEVALDSFMRESSIVQSVKNIGNINKTERAMRWAQQDYYVWDKIPEEHQDSYEHYYGVYSEEDKLRVDRMLSEKKMFERKASQYPVTSIASGIAGGAFSYGTAIPIGVTFKAYKLGQLAKNILKNSAQIGAVTAGSVALDEAIIREGTGKDFEDSLIDVTLSGALGMGIGGILGARAASKLASQTKDVIKFDATKVSDVEAKLTDEEIDKSIEAYQNGGETIGGFSDMFQGVAKRVVHPLRVFRNPVTSGLMGKLNSYAEYINDMNDHNVFTKKNMPAIDAPRGRVFQIEQQRAHNEVMLPFIKESNKIYNEYARSWEGGLVAKGAAKLKAKFSDDLISETEFQARAERMLVDPEYVDEIKAVRDMAELNRKFIREAGEQMQEMGILPKEVDVQSPWLYNIYRKNYILENKAKVIRLFADDFMENNKALTAKQALKSAEDAVNNILGTGPKLKGKDATSSDAGITGYTNAWSSGTGASFLKKRKITTSQKKMLEWGILDTSITHNTAKYLHKAQNLIQMKKTLDARGYTSVEDYIAKMNDEYNAASLKLTGKEAQRLKKERDLAEIEIRRTFRENLGLPGIEDAGALYDNEPARVWREYLGYVMLGGMGLTSLVESSVALIRTGPARAFFDGWMSKLKSAKFNKLSNEELAYLGYGVQHVQGEAIGRLIDGNSEYFGLDEVWGGARGVARQGFQNATGMSYLMNAFQRVGAKATQAKIAHKLRKWKSTGKMSDFDVTDLNSLGINKVDYDGILKQIEKYGGGKKAPFYMGFRAWDETAVSKVDGVPLKDKIQSAIMLSTNSIVNIPKVGDMQTWATNTFYGKMLTQFQSYFNRAGHAIFLSSLQRRDKNVAYAVVTAIGFGMAIERLKQETDSRRQKLEGADEWLMAGIQGSGYTTIGINQIIATAMLATAQHDGGHGRWAADRFGGHFYGPSVWGINNAAQAVAGLSDGELSTDSEKRKFMQSFVLGYGLPYMKALLNPLAGIEEED